MPVNFHSRIQECPGEILKKICWLLPVLVLQLPAFSQNEGVAFPKDIVSKSGQVVTIYQPQPESFSGNKLTGRSALSVRRTATSEPVFGAIFYEATVQTDKDTRIAECDWVKITRVKFPGVEDKAKLDSLTNIIETEVPKWNMRISIDALVATIKMENVDVSAGFNNKPPKIYYRSKPTTLISIDGEPKIQKEKNLDADRVVNTPSLIFKEGSVWNLYSNGVWYKSNAITSGWTQHQKLSKKLKEIDDHIKKEEAKNSDTSKPKEKPLVTDILVTTEPAELLQTKGEAVYKSIQGTELLYASNTTSQIFKEINTQRTYTVLSGRWYHAPSLEGPWEYIASDKLPPDFAKIPEGSEKDAVLANVAGTDAAEEAKIDAQIPQTAKVDRKEASIKVEYDGEPQFKPIEGTKLELAENASVTVIKDADGKFYAVENGIWFTSDKAKGPWAVSDERPKEIDEIPPTSSAYNTKYVYVYESSPEYVYVGYTPGYLGCYVYGPTVVYGTGFYYAPWFGTVYYPHPVTWGFGFCYNPYMGWGMGFGFGMAMGFMFSYGFGYGGWYGPPMHYPHYGYGGGYYGGINNGNINIGNDINIGGDGDRGGNRVSHHDGNRNNIYNNRNGVSTMDKKPGQSLGNRPGQGGTNRGQTGVNNQLPKQGNQLNQSRDRNNVYADKDGNIYQRDSKGNWSQRDNNTNGWNRSQSNTPSTNNLNRDSQYRNRGNMRTNNSRQFGGGGGGRSFGGGGGRRR